MLYALYHNGQFVRTQNFDTDPPILAPEKQMEWLPYTPPEPEPQPPYVPHEVSAFQAKAALLGAGLLSQVEAIMSDPATPEVQKLAWREATVFRRTSPTVAALAGLLGLADADLDELFRTAEQIEA